jgi:hypothetical protein
MINSMDNPSIQTRSWVSIHPKTLWMDTHLKKLWISPFLSMPNSAFTQLLKISHHYLKADLVANGCNYNLIDSIPFSPVNK